MQGFERKSVYGSPSCAYRQGHGPSREDERTGRRKEPLYLPLRKCKTEKQAVSPRKSAGIVNGPYKCWTMDIVQDNLANGRAIRILSVVDLWDRICQKLAVGFSQTGQNVITTLNALKEQVGLPRKMRTDNGPEFTCDALKVWAEKNGIALDTTRPCKPTDNGHIESFNGKLRDECLNKHIFESLEDARKR